MSTTAISKSQKPRPPPDVVKYPGLPKDWKAGNHYYFYGWAVTKEILQRYLSKTNRRVPHSEVGVASSVMYFMEKDVGFGNIFWVAGKVDSQAEAQGRVKQTESGPMLDLLAISCTRSKYHYWYRPTPQQLQQLVDFFGEEPRWFEDFNTKEEFIDDLVS